jgi:flagellar biosynthesis protein FlhF
MMVRTFYGTTTRDALNRVREALGPDAMILSNRNTAAGVEIMAVSEVEVRTVTANAAKRAAAAYTDTAAVQPIRERPLATSAAPAPDVLSVAPAQAAGPSYDLVQEVRFLRSMLEGQLAAFAWHELVRSEPAKIEVLRRLLAAGFSAPFSRSTVQAIAPGIDAARALRLVKMRLQSQLPVVPVEQTPVEVGGVYALVGPTGVGKTTTVAKIAAECTLKRGPDQVALVTTDTYRIGAVDQLRIYGRILGAPVFAIRSMSEFATTLTELRGRHLVLIDTVGMGQRDRRLADQIAMLVGGGKRVQRLLLLSGVAHINVLEDVVKAYSGPGLTGCILTKTDETLSLGGALDVLMRHRLPMHYVTNGQRVPEDLHRPNPLYLVERAFRAAGDSSAQPLIESDYPLVYAAAANADNALSGAAAT